MHDFDFSIQSEQIDSWGQQTQLSVLKVQSEWETSEDSLIIQQIVVSNLKTDCLR